MKFRKHELKEKFNLSDWLIEPILASIEPCEQNGRIKYYLLGDFLRAKKKIETAKPKVSQLPDGCVHQAGILDGWRLQLKQFKELLDSGKIPQHAGTYVCKSHNVIKYWNKEDIVKALGPQKKSMGTQMYKDQRDKEAKILSTSINLDKAMAAARRQNL